MGIDPVFIPEECGIKDAELWNKIIEEDPFFKNGIAKYEVTEFKTTKNTDDFSKFFDIRFIISSGLFLLKSRIILLYGSICNCLSSNITERK